MKRKIYDFLIQWKKSKNKECLLINGARQVGKTYIVREFGQQNYQTFIEINFMERPELCNIFTGNLSANEIYKRLSLYFPNLQLIPHETLIFLDEIQECANARTAEKFLAEDNKFDVIASGSLLGIELNGPDKYGNTAIIPVGYERTKTLYSLDFEEFLWSIGYDEKAINLLKENFINEEKINSTINKKFETLVREYIVVGGMPAVVKIYLEKNNFGDVQLEQEKIINSYKQDIVKHAPNAEKIHIKNCYESLPIQLAKENKKFQFSKVEARATSRKYGFSIEWLQGANLIHLCHNVSTPTYPLIAYKKEDQFKVYINDTGLLVAMYGFDMKKQILTNNVKGAVKGGIYENLIAETLVKKGYELCYYKKDNNRQKLEFIITKEGNIIPIEVKANNGATISLNEFIKEFNPPIAYKFIEGNIGKIESKLSLPHYLAMFI